MTDQAPRCAYTWIADGKRQHCRNGIDATKLCRWCPEHERQIRERTDPESLRLLAARAELTADARVLDLEAS